MPQGPDWTDWRQMLDTGMQFTAMTRAEAQRRAQRLVREGQLAQERVQSFVDDLVQSSRDRADALVDVVRREIQRQVEALGIATKVDLDRLEARVRKAEQASRGRPGAKAAKKRAAKPTKPKQTKKSGKKKAGAKKPARAS
jgi:polyhydroxyalkanoate synthesis regulator phasin